MTMRNRSADLAKPNDRHVLRSVLIKRTVSLDQTIQANKSRKLAKRFSIPRDAPCGQTAIQFVHREKLPEGKNALWSDTGQTTPFRRMKKVRASDGPDQLFSSTYSGWTGLKSSGGGRTSLFTSSGRTERSKSMRSVSYGWLFGSSG